MKLSDFQYDLPAELIAQHPAPEREAARLLSFDSKSGRRQDSHIFALADLLVPGDLLVFNDTRVLPARLVGRRSRGGRVEFLFIEPTAAGRWTALVKPAKKLKPHEVITCAEGALEVTLEERPLDEAGRPLPVWEVSLGSRDQPDLETRALLEAHGQMPLPPYIERADPTALIQAEDRERYQTVFAAVPGAVAAPTAGLHFRPALLDRLAQRGIERTSVTLHVGPGTFRPVTVENIIDHQMHSERFHLGARAVADIAACRRRKGRVVAVGTTTVRVLESCAAPDGSLTPQSSSTSIFITPGYKFRAVDGLLTNFHLPGSTLLMLVAAFIGRDPILDLYRHAIAERYRFFSYGDAQLLL